jgi:hypothetical protein
VAWPKDEPKDAAATEEWSGCRRSIWPRRMAWLHHSRIGMVAQQNNGGCPASARGDATALAHRPLQSAVLRRVAAERWLGSMKGRTMRLQAAIDKKITMFLHRYFILLNCAMILYDIFQSCWYHKIIL